MILCRYGEIVRSILDHYPGNFYYSRRDDAQVWPWSYGRGAGSVTLPRRPVKAGGSQVGSALAPGPLFLLAPHPKGEVAGGGAGPELGHFRFKLGHFGLETLEGCSLSLELIDFTADSRQLA